MTTIYNGNAIYGSLNFGLYPFEDILHDESKEAIQEAFESEYKDQIEQRLGSLFYGNNSRDLGRDPGQQRRAGYPGRGRDPGRDRLFRL